MFIKYLEKLLNVSSQEVPRVFYAWIIRFFFKFGLTIGVTTIIVSFVSRFGIERLPFFYLIQSLFVITGTVVFVFLLHFIDVKIQLYLSLTVSFLLILLSTLVKDNLFLYLGLLITVISFLLTQSGIFISNYIEDFFTPWEIHRISPLIESADTFGGISAALILSISVTHSFTDKTIFLWALSIITLLLTVHLLRPKSGDEIQIKHEPDHLTLERLPQKKVIGYIKAIKAVPFLQSLLVIVLLQWIIGHLVEFQYTKVVDESILSGLKEGSHELELMSGLSNLQLIFYSFALIFQLVLTSRILKFVGTFGGFVIHSIMTLLSSIGILFNFSYFTAVLFKNNFEVSGIIHRNAYEASYYAFKHGSQRSLREFYEGFINPIGLIIGTIILLSVQFIFVGTHFLNVINLILLMLAGLMVVISFQMQEHYTNYAYERLNKMDSPEAQEHAVSILAQKGHKNGIDILLKSLNDTKYSKDVRLKMIEELGKCGHTRVISNILPFIHSKDKDFQLAALRSLATFEGTSHHLIKSSFGKFKVIEELKILLNSKINNDLKKSVIMAMEHVNKAEIESILLDIMNSSPAELQLTCLDLLQTSNNRELAEYLVKFLRCRDNTVRARTALILLKFKGLREEAQKTLHQLSSAGNKKTWVALLDNLHYIEDKKLILWAINMKGSKDKTVKEAAMFAMAEIGDAEAVKNLANLLMDGEKNVICRFRKKADHYDLRLKTFFSGELIRAAFRNKFKNPSKNEDYSKYLQFLDKKTLLKLCDLFEILKLNAQRYYIQSLLQARNKFIN